MLLTYILKYLTLNYSNKTKQKQVTTTIGQKRKRIKIGFSHTTLICFFKICKTYWNTKRSSISVGTEAKSYVFKLMESGEIHFTIYEVREKRSVMSKLAISQKHYTIVI